MRLTPRTPFERLRPAPATIAGHAASDSTTLTHRRIHASPAQKFGAIHRGLPAEEQQARAAILEQAVHRAEHTATVDPDASCG
jgi:hypothetical protein